MEKTAQLEEANAKLAAAAATVMALRKKARATQETASALPRGGAGWLAALVVPVLVLIVAFVLAAAVVFASHIAVNAPATATAAATAATAAAAARLASCIAYTGIAIAKAVAFASAASAAAAAAFVAVWWYAPRSAFADEYRAACDAGIHIYPNAYWAWAMHKCEEVIRPADQTIRKKASWDKWGGKQAEHIAQLHAVLEKIMTAAGAYTRPLFSST